MVLWQRHTALVNSALYPHPVPQATRPEGKPLTHPLIPELEASCVPPPPLSCRLSPQPHSQGHNCPATTLCPSSLFTPILLDDCFTPPPPPHSQLTTSSDFAKKIEALGTGVVLAPLLPAHLHLRPSALPFLPLRQHPPLSHGRAAPFLVSFFFFLFLFAVFRQGLM